MTLQLLKRACVIFPKAEYLNPETVRHNRREWAKKIAYLRERGIWILDKPVMKQ